MSFLASFLFLIEPPPPAPEPAAEVPESVVLELAVEPAYEYNPIGKRDPFRSMLGGCTLGWDRGPEVQDYRMVGVIIGADGPHALLEDPDGGSLVITTGDRLGSQYALVDEITADRLMLVEEYMTIEGEVITNRLTLLLGE